MICTLLVQALNYLRAGHCHLNWTAHIYIKRGLLFAYLLFAYLA